MNVAGLTCTDWTSGGQQGREAGKQERHQAVWLAEREFLAKQDLEDLYISECAERYPAETIHGNALSATHELIVIRTGLVQL
eukprot:4116972-Lingulodinium_polyedra.AAC.1